MNYRHFNGMSWPATDKAFSFLEDKLRNSERGAIFTMEDRLAAAAVLAAYKRLVWTTNFRRNAAIRELRRHAAEVGGASENT